MVVRKHTEVTMENIMSFVENVLGFPAVKGF